jgi:hypothetical protein
VLKGAGIKLPSGVFQLLDCVVMNTIPTATPMFSGSYFSMVLSVTLPDETGSQKSKMAAEMM